MVEQSAYAIQAAALKILKKTPLFSDDEMRLIRTAKNVPPIQQQAVSGSS